MTKQVINVGIVANDKTGDPLRTAFTKVNQNFTELYTLVETGGNADLGNFKISGSILGTEGTDANTWGNWDMYLDPGGESNAGIYIPGVTNQSQGANLQIYNNNADGGAVQLMTGNGSWYFNNDASVTFPTLTTNLHNGGNQNAQTLQFGNPEQQVVITGPTPTGNNSAQRLIIQGQRGAGTGEGGDVYLWGGDAQLGGGDIKIYAGDADSGSEGYGGYVNISGGNGFTEGGHVNITAGNASGGTGADVSIRAGYGLNDANGTVSLGTGSYTWQFQPDGKLSGPIEGALEIDSNLIMNTDKGFVVEMGRFPMAIEGNDWWFDVVINKGGYVYCFGGADIEYNESGAPLIVKFDSNGNVVWKKYYSYPEFFNNPIPVSADFKTDSVISVLAESWVYDPGTDTNFDQLVYFEINTSDGSVVADSGYTLRASDTPENLYPGIWAKQIRYNSDKSIYAIVGSKFGDATNYTITSPSAISTTPGVLKILKSTLDTALGIANIWTYNNAYTIRGYGFGSTSYFTDVTTETIDDQVYYVLSTDSSVDFTTLPNGQSWIIRYYDTENGYIESNSWNKLVDFGGQVNWFSSVGFDSSNNIYAAGASNNDNSQPGDEISLLVSLTSTGTVRWAKRIDDDNGPGNNYIQGLAVSSDNYVYTVAKDNNGQTVIAKISSAGAVSWIKTMTIDGGMSGQYDARIVHCAVDNSVVFALEFGSISSVTDDFLLVKLDGNGALLWALSFGSSSPESVNWDYGQDFLSADDNFIYVSGSRYTGNDDNATVFAIPQSGDVSDWVGIYKVLDFSNNISFVTGSTLDTTVAITTTSSTNVVDSSFETQAYDAGYEVRRAYLNGGQNKLMNVAKIEFADGTTQRTSATDIPLTQIMTGEETTYLNEGHRGGFIISRYGADIINVPTHTQDPLRIGMVVTIILDQPENNNRVYVTGQDDGTDTVVIRPVGSDVYNNRYWSVGGDNVQGLYTLMKIDKNVWMLSGATINNED